MKTPTGLGFNSRKPSYGVFATNLVGDLVGLWSAFASDDDSGFLQGVTMQPADAVVAEDMCAHDSREALSGVRITAP